MQIEVLQGIEEFGPEVPVVEFAEAVLQGALRRINESLESDDDTVTFLSSRLFHSYHFMEHYYSINTSILDANNGW